VIDIRLFMNSSVEEVISFKCCNLHGLNLEIHLKNIGEMPVTVPGGCELVGEREEERFRIDYLYPPGPYTLQPGEPRACYCTLAEEIYERYRWIVFRDHRGREHRAPLTSK
jgi:hypothetical protein